MNGSKRRQDEEVKVEKGLALTLTLTLTLTLIGGLLGRGQHEGGINPTNVS